MKTYTSKDLLMSLLQFFSMNAEEQLNYAPNIPLDLNVRNFAFDLDKSPLLEMAEGTENISRVLTRDKKYNLEARETLEEFHAVLQLLVCCQHLADFGTAQSLRNTVEWRLIRKLGRECLRRLGVAPAMPTVPYEELVPLIMA